MAASQAGVISGGAGEAPCLLACWLRDLKQGGQRVREGRCRRREVDGMHSFYVRLRAGHPAPTSYPPGGLPPTRRSQAAAALSPEVPQPSAPPRHQATPRLCGWCWLVSGWLSGMLAL